MIRHDFLPLFWLTILSSVFAGYYNRYGFGGCNVWNWLTPCGGYGHGGFGGYGGWGWNYYRPSPSYGYGHGGYQYTIPGNYTQYGVPGVWQGAGWQNGAGAGDGKGGAGASASAGASADAAPPMELNKDEAQEVNLKKSTKKVRKVKVKEVKSEQRSEESESSEEAEDADLKDGASDLGSKLTQAIKKLEEYKEDFGIKGSKRQVTSAPVLLELTPPGGNAADGRKKSKKNRRKRSV